MNNIPHIVDSGSSYEPDSNIGFELKITKENPDGSADAIVRFNKAALEVLVQWGVVKMIEEGIKTYAPVSDKGRKPRTNASSTKKGRSRGLAKAKATVVAKKSSRKATRKAKV